MLHEDLVVEVLDLVAGAPRVAVDALVRAAAVEIHGVNKSEPGVGMPHAGKERLGLDLANPHVAMVPGLALLGRWLSSPRRVTSDVLFGPAIDLDNLQTNVAFYHWVVGGKEGGGGATSVR